MMFANTVLAWGLGAALTSVAAWAAPPRSVDQEAHGVRTAWQMVPVETRPGDAAHGWRYFVQPGEHRAVVISPSGDYYYSQGQGLARVFTAGRAG